MRSVSTLALIGEIASLKSEKRCSPPVEAEQYSQNPATFDPLQQMAVGRRESVEMSHEPLAP